MHVYMHINIANEYKYSKYMHINIANEYKYIRFCRAGESQCYEDIIKEDILYELLCCL